jgi:hypothetical protein
MLGTDGLLYGTTMFGSVSDAGALQGDRHHKRHVHAFQSLFGNSDGGPRSRR